MLGKTPYVKNRDMSIYEVDKIGELLNENGKEKRLDDKYENLLESYKAEQMLNENLSSHKLSNSPLIDAPFIPEKVYKLLPNSLSFLSSIKDRRIRDMLLLHTLTCIAALNPDLSLIAGNKNEHPSLYFHVLTNAASGKGYTGAISSFLYKMQMEMSEEDVINIKKWELEKQQALKIDKVPFAEPKPVMRSLVSSGNLTEAELMNIFISNPIHFIINTEVSGMAAKTKTQFGDGLIDNYCKAYHQEFTDSQTQSGGKKWAYNPKLCISLASTPEQVLDLVKSPEKGFLSRFTYYIFKGQSKFKHQRLPEFNILKDIPKDLGDTFKNITKKGGCFVDFTEDQDFYIQKNGEYFMKQIMLTHDHDSASQIAIRSGGAQLMRIAAILTQTRRIDEGAINPDENLKIVCDQKDFESSMLIAQTIFSHNLRMFSYIADSTTKRVKPLSKANEKSVSLFKVLPENVDFSRKEAIEIAREKGLSISDRWIDGKLKEWKENGSLKSTIHGIYSKDINSV